MLFNRIVLQCYMYAVTKQVYSEWNYLYPYVNMTELKWLAPPVSANS